MKRILLILTILFVQSISFAQTIPNLDGCYWARQKNIDISLISKYAWAFINKNSDGDCMFQFLDTIYAKITVRKEYHYFDLLNSLCNKSDGAVSEGLAAYANHLFYESFDSLIDYLYKKQKSGDTASLQQFVIFDLSIDMQGNDYPRESKKIYGYLDKQIMRYKAIDPGKENYLLWLKTQIDPSRF